MESCHTPVTACLCSALAMMLFSDEFKDYVVQRQWGSAAWFIIVAWLGFFIFWAIVYGVFNAIKEKIPKRLRKYQKTAEAVVAMFVFCFLYYMGHYVI